MTRTMLKMLMETLKKQSSCEDVLSIPLSYESVVERRCHKFTIQFHFLSTKCNRNKVFIFVFIMGQDTKITVDSLQVCLTRKTKNLK